LIILSIQIVDTINYIYKYYWVSTEETKFVSKTDIEIEFIVASVVDEAAVATGPASDQPKCFVY
jgi:hypothetical protein